MFNNKTVAAKPQGSVGVHKSSIKLALEFEVVRNAMGETNDSLDKWFADLACFTLEPSFLFDPPTTPVVKSEVASPLRKKHKVKEEVETCTGCGDPMPKKSLCIPVIQCDQCHSHFHLKCARLKRRPKYGHGCALLANKRSL